jgi:4-aminobutyrate aminotransferase-like enzyme
VLKLRPPLVFDDQDLDRLIDGFSDALTALGH